MEVLWTFSDIWTTFWFIWVFMKWILMFEFSHTTAIQRTVTSYIRDMMAFSYSFIKCIGLFCQQVSITSALLFLSFLSLLELFYLCCFTSTSFLLNICFSLFSLRPINLPFSCWISFCYFLPIFLTPLGYFVLWLNKTVHGLHERRDRVFVGLFLLNHSENCTVREGFITFNYLARIY